MTVVSFVFCLAFTIATFLHSVLSTMAHSYLTATYALSSACVRAQGRIAKAQDCECEKLSICGLGVLADRNFYFGVESFSAFK